MGASVEITRNEFAEKGATAGIGKMIVIACTKITARAKALCPIDLGQLRNTIMWKTAKEEKGFNNEPLEQAPGDQKITLQPKITIGGKIQSGYVGTNSDHWYPEFGTRFQIAQPYMRPAKEIVMDGGRASEIGKKYGAEEMAKEYARRKVTRQSV